MSTWPLVGVASTALEDAVDPARGELHEPAARVELLGALLLANRPWWLRRCSPRRRRFDMDSTARTPKLLTENHEWSRRRRTRGSRARCSASPTTRGAYDAVAPFVLSRPPWLVVAGAADQSAAQGEGSRGRASSSPALRLPDLYINPTRYLRGKQSWRASRHRALRHDQLHDRPVGVPNAAADRCGYKTFCLPYCDSHREDGVARHVDAPGRVSAAIGGEGRGSGGRMSCSVLRRLPPKRRAYRHVNFTDEGGEDAGGGRTRSGALQRAYGRVVLAVVRVVVAGGVVEERFDARLFSPSKA